MKDRMTEEKLKFLREVVTDLANSIRSARLNHDCVDFVTWAQEVLDGDPDGQLF